MTEDCGEVQQKDSQQKDSSSYERHPLKSTNNGAEKYRVRSNENEFHRDENAENYANNKSYGRGINNMNSYHKHYHQPQSRYDHPKSTSHERRRPSTRISARFVTPSTRAAKLMVNCTPKIHQQPYHP